MLAPLLQLFCATLGIFESIGGDRTVGAVWLAAGAIVWAVRSESKRP